MVPLNVSSVPAELPQKTDMIDYSAPGPMPLQEVGDSHGHEIYLQKFVRLVGCHDPNAGKHAGAYRLN
jgi:hypothetical protein